MGTLPTPLRGAQTAESWVVGHPLCHGVSQTGLVWFLGKEDQGTEVRVGEWGWESSSEWQETC